MGIETALPAALSIGSSLLGAGASSSAANAQANATNRATDLQQQMYDKQVALQDPYRQAGLTGQNRLMDLLGLSGNTGAEGYGSAMRNFGMSDFQQDPGYGFRMTEGLKALDRSAAARGGLISGAALKGAQRYGQDMASQEYQNAFNRYQTNRSNMLAPLVGLQSLGQNAAANVGNAGANYASNAGNLMQQGAIAQGAGMMGAANALSGGASQYLNYNQNQNLLNAVQNRSGYTPQQIGSANSMNVPYGYQQLGLE